jgi:hypothetical protein
MSFPFVRWDGQFLFFDPGPVVSYIRLLQVSSGQGASRLVFYRLLHSARPQVQMVNEDSTMKVQLLRAS